MEYIFVVNNICYQYITLTGHLYHDNHDKIMIFIINRTKAKANSIVRDYVLPDYAHIKRGYIKHANDESHMEGHQQVETFEVLVLKFFRFWF